MSINGGLHEYLGYPDEGPDDEPTELDLVYDDLHAAQDLIDELLAALTQIANYSADHCAAGYMRTIAEAAILKSDGRGASLAQPDTAPALSSSPRGSPEGRGRREPALVAYLRERSPASLARSEVAL